MAGPIDFFDAIAPRYDRDYARESTLVRERVARLAQLLDGRTRVLDLGIGTGRELPALSDAGLVVTGVDASAPMLEACAARGRAAQLVQADFFRPLPFDDASFDAVVALHGTLAHPTDEGALARLAAEAARVLAPGGVFFAEVPSPSWLDAVDAGLGDDEQRAAARVGDNRARLVDRRTRASVEAVVLTRDEWLALLDPRFAATVEAISPYEWLVVGTRTSTR